MGFIFAALFCGGCAGELPAHTYWLENTATGTYTTHRTYTPLSEDEIQELNLVTELPADAKVID